MISIRTRYVRRAVVILLSVALIVSGVALMRHAIRGADQDTTSSWIKVAQHDNQQHWSVTLCAPAPPSEPYAVRVEHRHFGVSEWHWQYRSPSAIAISATLPLYAKPAWLIDTVVDPQRLPQVVAELGGQAALPFSRRIVTAYPCHNGH